MINYRDFLYYKKGMYACGTFSHPSHIEPYNAQSCEHPWGNWLLVGSEKAVIHDKEGKEYYQFLCEVCTKQFTVSVEEWEKYVQERLKDE